MAKVILLEFSVLYFVSDHFLRTNYEEQQYLVKYCCNHRS